MRSRICPLLHLITTVRSRASIRGPHQRFRKYCRPRSHDLRSMNHGLNQVAYPL